MNDRFQLVTCEPGERRCKSRGCLQPVQPKQPFKWVIAVLPHVPGPCGYPVAPDVQHIEVTRLADL